MSYIGLNQPQAIGTLEGIPVGTFIHYAGEKAPQGFLVCDGSEVSQEHYPLLYAAIGDTWNNTAGASDPAPGNFRLPPQDVDGLGLFLRGVGDATEVGDYQDEDVGPHTHNTEDSGQHSHTILRSGAGAAANTGHSGSVNAHLDPGTTSASGTHSHAVLENDGEETRPRSLTTLLCIKASQAAFQSGDGTVPINAVAEPQLDVPALQASGLLPTAWCVFDGTLTGTNPPLAGFNVASITHNSAGNYTITFASPFDNANFAVVSAGNAPESVVDSASKTTTSVTVIEQLSAGTPADVGQGQVIVFGGKD